MRSTLFPLLLFMTTLPVLAEPQNLLINCDFQFLSFDASRTAASQSHTTGSVPFWDQEAYGDADVWRGPFNPVGRTTVPVDGVVVLHPGKSLRQFRLLSELRVDPGETVTLSVRGRQPKSGGLRAAVRAMKLDQQEGEWKPSDFGQKDSRAFPRAARGEMTPVEIAAATADTGEGDFILTLPAVTIPDGKTCVGLEIVFTNTSDADIALYSPQLARTNEPRPGAETAMSDAYRHLPRTISKLRRGEPLHIVVMGSSIDRGSANPPMYRYDEDPASPTFKQPLSTGDFLFEGSEVGHPEWTPYFGQWRHYFSYTGRLRRALMRRFDYPADKLLFNFMACDGSCISESHSALAEWATLQHAPNPELNGHKAGKSWAELYPALFARPEGPRPDLVIFGSGANEKIDGPEEIAAFEGAIRWFQRHYPGVEFVFCLWQFNESSTPNPGMLKELALRYGIPFIDVGRTLALATRNVDPLLLRPKDGHPQAAAHDLWARSLESAFQPRDPVAAGFPQQHLPERATPYTIGWEGEVATYTSDSPRVRKGTAFVLDDTVVNLWATGKDKEIGVRIDGQNPRELDNRSRFRVYTQRDPRNSTFSIGRLALGERHLLELLDDARISAVDSKKALNRQLHGVEQRRWKLPRAAEAFASDWGAPYGSHKAALRAGEKATVEWTGTDCSVAWLSRDGGGTLIARVDGTERLRRSTAEPVTLASGETLHMENRAGILRLPYGVHRLEIEATGGDIDLIGLFSYDTRANRAGQRVVQGMAMPGETVAFDPPFRATPVVLGGSGLKVGEVTPASVTFAPEGEGAAFQAEGE